MGKRIILGFLLAAALFSTRTFAAQNVANTSQKGSLLIWPLIDIRTANTATTLIEISNDANQTAAVTCYYINERKGRRDFHFAISPKGTVSWDVLTHSGSIAPAVFPNDGSFPGDVNVGELICFATDGAVSTQVRFNHLTGSATVVYFADADANIAKQAFKYNAWAFTARSILVPPPRDGTPVGVPGTLLLTGNGDGTYDACPLYLIANFSPSGAVLGGVTFVDNDLSVSACNQDLRQDFVLHLTKLRFLVWNEFETEFSGSYQCANSVLSFGLDPEDQPQSGGLVAPENFTFTTLRTNNARFEVDGVASSQCPGSISTGLVAVLSTSIGIGGTPGTEGEDAEIGNTIHGAGAEAGFVLWDPQPPIVPDRTRSHGK